MMLPDSDEARLRNRLLQVRDQSIELAGILTAVVGIVIAMVCVLGDLAFHQPHLKVAAGVAIFGFVLGVLEYLSALRQWRQFAMMLVVCTTLLPSLYFILGELAGPLGGTSGLFGPVVLLYAFSVASSSFLLRPSLPLLSGAFAAVQLLGIYSWVRADISSLSLPPEVMFEATNPLAWIFRAMFVFAVGVAGWGTSRQARRLLSEMLAEQREALTVTQLFGQFVSADIRDKILNERSNLQGERLEVAVLFADIRGFTSWSENQTPNEVVRRLNQYFGAMVEAVEGQGGVVDKFMGDGLMAMFGGLVPLANPSLAAVQSAIGMLSAMERLNEEWVKAGGAPFRIGIGIAYGPVIQGPVGNEKRREFTVTGDTVNTASRLESLTKELKVELVVSDAVASRVNVPLVELGTVELRGKAAAQRVWGLKNGRSHF